MSWGNKFITHPKVQEALDAPGAARGSRMAPILGEDTRREEIARLRGSQGAKKSAHPSWRERWPWSAMNNTEARFANEKLELNENVLEWHFESINLRLGPNTFYRPDFVVNMKDGRSIVMEVKGGFIRDDAIAKFHAAALRYGLIWIFELWQYTKRDGWKCIDKV